MSVTIHDPVMRDLAKHLNSESRAWDTELAYEKHRAEHDITGSMDKVYAQNFVAAVAELVDVHHDDDTELGRHVRRLIEQEYRKQFWAYQIADATLAARES